MRTVNMRCHTHWPMFRRRFQRCLALVLIAGALMATRAPADTPVPPKSHAEEHTYDETSGRWVRTPDPLPGTEDGDLDIARQWMAREDYETAGDILKQWIKIYGADSPRYPEALYLQATAYLERGRYREAREIYQTLLNEFPASDYAEPVLWGQLRIGEQYLAGKRRRAWGGLLRVRDYEGGLEIMDDLIVNYADTPLAELARMTKADYYFAQGEYELAEDEYATFAREYPKSRWQPRALLRSAQSALASFPGIQFDDAGLVEAQERFDQFRRLYPDVADEQGVPVVLEQIASTRADKTCEIGRFYEKTGQPRAARFYYRAVVRSWPDAPAASQAKGRLAALGEPVASPEAPWPDAPPGGAGEEGGR